MSRTLSGTLSLVEAPTLEIGVQGKDGADSDQRDSADKNAPHSVAMRRKHTVTRRGAGCPILLVMLRARRAPVPAFLPETSPDAVRRRHRTTGK